MIKYVVSETDKMAADGILSMFYWCKICVIGRFSSVVDECRGVLKADVM